MHDKFFPARLILVAALFLSLMSTTMRAAAAEAQAVEAQADDGRRAAVLAVANRKIAVFRSAVGNLSPQQRTEVAAERAYALTGRELDEPVTAQSVTVGEQRAQAIFVGPRPIFALLPADLEPLSSRTLEEEAALAARNLAAALEAMRAQQRPQVIARGIVLSLAATIGFALSVWFILRLRRRVKTALENAAQPSGNRFIVRGVDMAAIALSVLGRMTGFVTALAILTVAYLWITFVLRQFPYTEPWGDALADNLFRLLQGLALNVIAAIPGLTIVLVIFTVAYLSVQFIKVFLRAVEQKSVSVPFMHADTARPTMWLASGAIWLFAIAIAYPYIPGSDSPAFQGISVIVGLMATLGSAGAVNQGMSGLILLYSRALKKGEFVRIGNSEGIVSSVGWLSTKLENDRHEEITIPNTVVIGAEIRNYSRIAETTYGTIAAMVSIGYDSPWRQVVAILKEAAHATRGIRRDVAPRVMQRALGDFYVSYELIASIERPDCRGAVLNELLGNIQDKFNQYGVQIMSPNFVAQPEQKVFVPGEQWYSPPANREPDAP